MVEASWESISQIQDLESIAEPLRRRLTLAYITFNEFEELLNKLEPEKVRYVLDNINEVIQRTSARFNATICKESPDRYLLVYGYPDLHPDEALRCMTHLCDLHAQLMILRHDLLQQGLNMPKPSMTAHVGEVLAGPLIMGDQNQYQVMGQVLSSLRSLSVRTPAPEIHITDELLDEIISQLPSQWSTIEHDESLSGPSAAHFSGFSEPADYLEDAYSAESVFDSAFPSQDHKSETEASHTEEGSSHGPSRVGWKTHIVSIVFTNMNDEETEDQEFLCSSVPRHGADQADVSNIYRLKHTRGNPHRISFDQRVASDVGAQRLFGKYRLSRLLGRGGMGEVWQGTDTFGNAVAVKMLIAGGMASDRQLKRFRREAEIMAQLNHRNICRIYEVGEVGEITYISMEFVAGVSLSEILNATDDELLDFTKSHIKKKVEASDTHVGDLVKHLMDQVTIDPDDEKGSDTDSKLEEITYRKRKKRLSGTRYNILPLQQSLSIISQLADAVQFAHESGIYHRDIKPANIMLRSDGEPVVMDFGLAKLTNETDGQSLSITDQIMGTIDYMAPEQAISAKDIDERADVYAIGAVLYQLTTGEKHFKATGNLLFDAQRLQEHIPKRPRQLVRRLDHDLELIILKALRNDPDARYRNVAGFREDIERYRRGEIIFARDITLREIMVRNIKRNKTMSVLIIASLLITIISAAASYTFVFIEESKTYEANEKLRVALDEYKNSERRLAIAQENAVEEASRSQAAKNFLMDIFLHGGGQEDDWRDWRVPEALRNAVNKMEDRFHDDPLLEAEIHQMIGEIYAEHEEWQFAQDHFEKSYDTRKRELGASHPKTMSSAAGLGSTYTELGDLDKAYELLSMVYRQRVIKLGEEHPRTLASAFALGLVYHRLGEYRKSEAIFRSLIMFRPLRADSSRWIKELRIALAASLRTSGQFKEARETLENALSELGNDEESLRTRLFIQNSIAVILMLEGQEGLAYALLQEVYGQRERLLGANAPDTLRTLQDLSSIAASRGMISDALDNKQMVYDELVKRMGPEAPELLQIQMEIARLIVLRGEKQAGYELFEELIKDYIERVGIDHPLTLQARLEYERLKLQYDENNVRLEEVRAISSEFTNLYGNQHPMTLEANQILANIYLNQRRVSEAKAIIEQNYNSFRRAYGDLHYSTLETMELKAIMQWRLIKYDESIATFQQLLRLQVLAFGEEHPKTLMTRKKFANLLFDAARYDESHQQLSIILSDWYEVRDDQHDQYRNIIKELIMIDERLGMNNQAIDLANKLRKYQSNDMTTYEKSQAELRYIRQLRINAQYQEAEELLNALPRNEWSMAWAREVFLLHMESQNVELAKDAYVLWLSKGGRDQAASVERTRMQTQLQIAEGNWNQALSEMGQLLNNWDFQSNHTQGWYEIILFDYVTMLMRHRLWEEAHPHVIELLSITEYPRTNLYHLTKAQAYRNLVEYRISPDNNENLNRLRQQLNMFSRIDKNWISSDPNLVTVLAELLMIEGKDKEARTLLDHHLIWLSQRYPLDHWRQLPARALLINILRGVSDEEVKRHEKFLNQYESSWGQKHILNQWLEYYQNMK